MSTTQRDELAAVVRELGGRLTSAVADLHGLVINDCLSTETVTIDAGGALVRDWTVPYGSVAIHNGSSESVTVTNDTPSGSAPAGGAGVAVIPAGVAATVNLTGRTLTVYGPAGGRLVLSVFTKSQAPAWASLGAL